jgi:hypothetical protein
MANRLVYLYTWSYNNVGPGSSITPCVCHIVQGYRQVKAHVRRLDHRDCLDALLLYYSHLYRLTAYVSTKRWNCSRRVFWAAKINFAVYLLRWLSHLS